MNKKTIIQRHFQKLNLLHLQNPVYKKCVDDLCEWLLRNDRAQRDTTTKLLFPKTPKEINARIYNKEALTVAGIEEVNFLLNAYTDIQSHPKTKDGETIKENTTILELRGSAAEILAFERTILNMLQRLSGIATVTQQIVSQIAALDLPHEPLIAATRKTQWTLLDKKAVALGGGGTHRLDLADGVLVKDNHLMILREQYALEKEVDLAVKTFEILSKKAQDMLIEIEVEKKESIEALLNVSSSLAHTNTLCILLDNFSPKDAKETLQNLQNTYDLSKIIFEASGGINKNNISEWAETGVDVISLGALTHSAQAVDISLDVA